MRSCKRVLGCALAMACALPAVARADVASDATALRKSLNIGTLTGMPSGRTTYRTTDEFNTELEALAAAYPTQVVVKTRRTRASRAARSSTSRSPTTSPRSATASRCSSTWAGSTATRRAGAEDSLEFAYDVLQQAKTNPKVAALLDKVRLIDMPLVNPDGYAFKNAARPPHRAARAAVRSGRSSRPHVHDHGRRPQPQLSVRLGLEHRRQPRPRGSGPGSEPEVKNTMDIVLRATRS